MSERSEFFVWVRIFLRDYVFNYTYDYFEGALTVEKFEFGDD